MIDTTNAYGLRGYGPEGAHERWWHPAAVYTDIERARTDRDELTARYPGIELTIETVPLDPHLARYGAGRMYLGTFEFDDDGAWSWSCSLHPMDQEAIDDEIIESPYSIDHIDKGDSVEWERVYVLAHGDDEAMTKATSLIAEEVRGKTGKEPRYEEDRS